MNHFKTLLLGILLSCLSDSSYGCFILFYTDGDRVMVANHEDWFTKDAAVRFLPRTPYRYASILFTFKSEGWPQGGMNEKGLFFDAAHTPYQELEHTEALKKAPGFLWQHILDKASTVKEALSILESYQIPELEEATILLADRSGDAAIIGLHNNSIDVRRVTGNYLLQTNFNQWHPELGEEKVCNRFVRAGEMLSTEPSVTLETMTEILKATHQNEMTVYSNVYDLKDLAVHTYSNRDFEHPITIKISDYMGYGECMVLLEELKENDRALETCAKNNNAPIRLEGFVQDSRSNKAIPFANIGIRGKNIGTLSDPDGKFEIVLPAYTVGDTVIISSLGYSPFSLPVSREVGTGNVNISLESEPIVLKEVVVSERKLHRKTSRLGWMGGKDGILPLDTIQGGGVVALLVESPSIPFHVEKLQVRLMYNSNPAARFRFHLYAFDSISGQPGEELLREEIMLSVDKRFAWLRFDLSEYNIELKEKKFFIGFEWIEDQQTRKQMIKGLREFEHWKSLEFQSGNPKLRHVTDDAGNKSLKYFGNMMDWPGFDKLPPFTGLVIETGKSAESAQYRTFERKTSFGDWKELNSTLNAVVTIRH